MSTSTPINTTTTTPIDTSSSSSTAKAGANSLSSSDFMKLMITQLQQQDPTNPTDSNQILTQLSQISTLQSNTAMQASLQGLTLQQSIGAGGNLIGKSVTGKDAAGGDVTGTVTGVLVQNQKVILQVSGVDGNNAPVNTPVPMENLTSIAAAAPVLATPATAGAASAGGLQSLLNMFSGLIGGGT